MNTLMILYTVYCYDCCGFILWHPLFLPRISW